MPLYYVEHYRSEGKDGTRWNGGESPLLTAHVDSRGELFADLRREHGRCTSAMYRDKKDGRTVQVGWVFQKREKYTDVNETYLAETWVEVFAAPPTVTPHPLEWAPEARSTKP